MGKNTETTSSATTFGLLRHGQTEWNLLKKIQGSADSPLTQKGKKDTGEWAATLESYGWNRILASDLGRVRETVEIINSKLQLPVTFDKRLREQNWGEWEGLTIPFIQQNFKEDLEERVARGWDFSAPGGETREFVKERVLVTLLEKAKQWPGTKILVVCHQGVVKAVLYALTKRQFLPGEDPLLQHNRLHLISYNQERFSPLQMNIPRTTKP